MTVASAQTLRRLQPVRPFEERQRQNGMSFGLSACGYDVRIDLDDKWAGEWWMPPGEFLLASTLEEFNMPPNLVGIVHDKSTWARKGLAVQNTVIEPGWRGYLTLELTNHGNEELCLQHGDPIAQILFHLLDEETEQPYQGKYQDQERGAQAARFE
jgi:dCTP deaminase